MENGDLELDENEINRLITEKYKKMFKDEGKKIIYNHDKVITITAEEVTIALNHMKDKAVSWDMIPGKVFLQLKEKKELHQPLANLLNEILRKGEAMEVLFIARMICLNKDAEQAGRLDNIRPIAVMSTFIKLIERVLYARMIIKVVNEDVISNKQIGFMRRCGTDLNLIKLRIKIEEVKRTKRGHRKCMFFIDLKSAYDLVNHEILFAKLRLKGFDEEMINTIKMIYSKSKVRIGPLGADININGGVLQGSTISPLLFNIYIDDLVRELASNSFEVLAYADDIAIICETDGQLENVMSILEKWAEKNDMKVNKDKSGIIYLGVRNGKSLKRSGYPVLDRYRYLGVIVNQYGNCTHQVDAVNKKVEMYLKRNGKLLFKYFSPRSLLKIHHYFHRSRLMYGMSAFVDIDSCMKKLDKKVMKMAKTTFKLPMSTSHCRIRATLGLVSTKPKLICSLIKNLAKYKEIFREEVDFYNKVILEHTDKLDFNDVEGMIIDIERRSLDSDIKGYLNVDVWSDVYREAVRKEVFNTYDKRSVFTLKYLCNSAFYKARYKENCPFCPETWCSREHIADVCQQFEISRSVLREGLVRLRLMRDEELLSMVIDRTFFNPPIDKKKRNKSILLMSAFFVNIHTTDRRAPGPEEADESDMESDKDPAKQDEGRRLLETCASDEEGKKELL